MVDPDNNRDPRTNVAHLEKMVELAEDVSRKTFELRRTYNRSYMRMIISIIFLYAIGVGGIYVAKMIFKEETISVTWIIVVAAGGSVLFFLSLFALFSNFYSYRNLRRELYVEKTILKDLLTMLFEFKNSIEPLLDPVENALLEIRLKRIRFFAD